MTASNAGPLISVGELAEAVAAGAAPVLLDVRWRLGGPPGFEGYRAGHLPGAVFVDLDTQLAGPPGDGGRHPMPDTPAFEAAMRAVGVRDDSPVVVYDEADATTAARAWWLLRYHGHPDVRVLDGGLQAWAAAGLPVSTTVSHPERGDFTARPGALPVLDAAGAAEVARSGILLDARAPARYRGETEPVDKVAGHIPGALSSPSAENVTIDGGFRPADELRARFASLGIGAPGDGSAGAAGDAQAADHRQVGAYCGSGVVAAHEVLALELAGVPAALYVGSWSGWITDPARPVATGPRPGTLPGTAPGTAAGTQPG
jgi:thiosulfate/3-mercaptopyruvate sulfurtransferase